MMISGRGHISEIYTKPLGVEVKITDKDNNEEATSMETLPKKKQQKKPKNEPHPKNAETPPKPDPTFQIIEKELKMKTKRETPGRKGLKIELETFTY